MAAQIIFKPLTYLLLFVSFNCLAAEFEEKQDGSMVIKLTAEEMLECAKKGGCVIISLYDVQQVVKNAASHMCGKSI